MLFLLALRWGPVGIAGAWTASFCVLAIPAFWYAGKPIELPATAMLKAIWRYVVAALIAGSSCAAIVGHMRWMPLVAPYGLAGTITRIITNSALFTLLYLAAVLVLFGGPEPVRQFARLIPDLIPGVSSWRKSKSVGEPDHLVTRPIVESAVQQVTFENE